MDRELKRQDTKVKSLLKDGTLLRIAESFSLKTTDDLLSAIGYGKISVKKVLTKLAPKEGPEEAKESGPLQKIFQEATRKNKDRIAVTVKGVEDLLVRFARCCNPVPGDSVVGFITRGRGISVHSKKCPAVFESDPHRLVDIDWDLTKRQDRNVKVRVLSQDRPGLLADLSKEIRDQNVNITRAEIGTTKDKKAVCIFSIAISDLKTLKKVISMLEGIPGVVSASRVQKKS